jgi:hypothetical protein
MRLPSPFRKRGPSTEHRTTSRGHEATNPLRAGEAQPIAPGDGTEPTAAAGHAPAPRRPASPAVSAARLDELRTQAKFARERYDLYKAKSYGPHLTSPARLRELERESARTAANLSFARSEGLREAGAVRGAGAPGDEGQTRVRTGTG